MGLDNQISIPATNRSNLERGASLRDAKARIPRNVLSNWASYAVNLPITFLILPLVVHRLGSTAYGIWGIIGQVMGYSFLLDLGIRIAVTRYVARHVALDEPRVVNTVLTTGLAFSLIPASLVLVGGVAGAHILPRLFPIPPELVWDARLSFFIVATGVALSFPGSLFNGCVAAVSRYDLLSIRYVIPNIIKALLLWYFLVRGYGLVTVALVGLVAISTGYTLDYVFARSQFPSLSIRREFFNISTLRTLMNFSVYAFILSVSWRMLFMTDSIVVGFVLGPVAVTFYSVGMNLVSLLRESIGNIANLYSPLASQMDAVSQEDSLRRLFTSGSRIALLYVLAGVVSLTVLGPRFLGFWLGESFIGRTGPVVILLAIEAGFYTLCYTCGQVLYGMNRHKVNAWLSLGNATANLTLSTIMVRWWGAVGVAWGTIIPAFVIEAIIVPVYTASLLNVSPGLFYKSVVLRPLIAAAPYGLWLWFWRAQGLVHGYGSLALVVGSGLALYALLAWTLSLDDQDRIFARKVLMSLKAMAPGTERTEEAPGGESSPTG